MKSIDEMDLSEVVAEISDHKTLPARLEEIEEFFHMEGWDNREEIVPHIARHLNCPLELFVKLAPQFPEAAAENPAWNLLMIEGAMLALRNKVSLFFELLKKETIPEPWMPLLENSPHPTVRQQLKHHHQVAGELDRTSDAWQFEIADTLVRELVRDSRLVWLKRQSTLPDWINTRLPYAIPDLPQRHTYTTVSPHTLDEFAQSKGGLAPCLALMQIRNLRFLENKADTVHWHLRLGVALNPVTKHEILKRLVNDGNRYVKAVAKTRLENPDWQFAPSRTTS
jgi:hypothetical protein